MKELSQMREALLEGDIKTALKIRESMIGSIDPSTEKEMIEIVRESMIVHLKSGSIRKAEMMAELFPLPKRLLNETLKQAMLSCFRDGDVKRVIEIKNRFPLPKKLGKEMVVYCADKEQEFCRHCMLSVFA